MRLIIKTLLALLVIAAIAPFTLPLKNGEPLLKWSELNLPKLPGLPAMPDFSSGDTQEAPSRPVTTYKWQDAEGNWHLGDTPPPNTPYKTITVDPNTNLIQATTPAPAAQPTTPEPDNKRPALPDYSPAMAYDPEKVSEVMDKARNVENLIQQRQEQQNKLLEAIQ